MQTVNDLLKIKGNQVWSIEYNATIKDALQLLAQKDVGALTVLKNGQLVGIFSERDYARKMAQLEQCSLAAPVSEIMTSRVLVVNNSNSVEECMSLMTDKHIRHLPVLEGDKLVGIISIGDLVKAITSDQTEKISQLENYIQGKW
jgi:CBS domain-containing protein